jgi:hypothetical protein
MDVQIISDFVAVNSTSQHQNFDPKWWKPNLKVPMRGVRLEDI